MSTNTIEAAKPRAGLAGNIRPADISPESWQLMIGQGVVESARYENLLGAGADLWDSDEEFDEFLLLVKQIREQKDST